MDILYIILGLVGGGIFYIVGRVHGSAAGYELGRGEVVTEDEAYEQGYQAGLEAADSDQDEDIEDAEYEDVDDRGVGEPSYNEPGDWPGEDEAFERTAGLVSQPAPKAPAGTFCSVLH